MIILTFQDKQVDQPTKATSSSQKQTSHQGKSARALSQNKSNSLPSTSQSNSSPNSRRNYNQRHSGPKSASFSAFDKNNRMHLQKPVILVRNPQLANASGITGKGYLQQNPTAGNAIFLQPGLTNFQPQAYQTVVSQCLQADASVVQRSMYMQNLRQCQLTRSPSPVTFVRSPHPAVISTASDNLTQTLLKSQSATDLAALQSLKLQQQQQQQQQLMHQNLLLKTGNSPDCGVSDVHRANIYTHGQMFQPNLDRQFVDNDSIALQNHGLAHSMDRSNSLNVKTVIPDVGQDYLHDMHFLQDKKHVLNRFDDQAAHLSVAASIQKVQNRVKESRESSNGDIIVSKMDDLGIIF